ncbi:SDR family NAD(P)-dependent oxidoreductase [Rhizobium leguminosarum]|nr:SDR family NAD(P)-dependent oxidoreductase [Rhizobium leguminosarum]TBG06963.1 SDR family NAD(P)-dependent oxidoreductase [Rhizobium leguminosarum]TBG07834.1 SDR family NAD(P)-dependent oxidoreductase [Rhizobium leguminosarum]TBG30000.1 SDR family NAD(P)-dependent oxidoreductase [Rhizobium leguminosarum]TBG50133.1 SDR family NAD(P)-dependent oxidoreductase [Rhizobium leguminosarum]
MAQSLVANGQQVWITARRSEDVADIAAMNPATTSALKLDVTNKDAMASAVRAAEERNGATDVLVNDAGYGYFGASRKTEVDAARRMFETNFWGFAEPIETVLPTMRKRRSGPIVSASRMFSQASWHGRTSTEALASWRQAS